MASLLVANSITGAATLFRREVAELALPFPETPGMQFHDHWLGLVALAAGDIAYVDRPLYDYVQHGGAIFGDVAGGSAGSAPAAPRRSLATALADRLRGGRGAYFLGYLPRDVQARALLVLCDSRLTAPKRRALKRFIDRPTRPPPSPGSPRGRCGCWRAGTRRWVARRSSPGASSGGGSSRFWPRGRGLLGGGRSTPGIPTRSASSRSACGAGGHAPDAAAPGRDGC